MPYHPKHPVSRRPPRYVESQKQESEGLRQLCLQCYQLTTKMHLCNPLCRNCSHHFHPGGGACDGFCGSYPCCGCCSEVQEKALRPNEAYRPLVPGKQLDSCQIHFPDLRTVMGQLVDFIFSEKKLQLDFERGIYRSVITAMGGRETFINLVYNTLDPDVRALRGQAITMEALHAIRRKQTSNPSTWEPPHGGYLDFVTQPFLPTYVRFYGRSLSPYSRHKAVQLLSDSPDPEFREWVFDRNNEKHHSRRITKTEELSERSILGKDGYYRPLFQTLADSLNIDEDLSVQTGEEIWGPLPLQTLDLESWFQSAVAKLRYNDVVTETNTEMISPVGCLQASIGVVFEPTPLRDYDESGPCTVRLPWGLRESGFHAANSLIWPVDLRRYVYIPDSFQAQSFSVSERNALREVSQQLIAGSHLRVIIMCGEVEETILPTNAKKVVSSEIPFNIWIEIYQRQIARIFVRAPTPLSELWASHGRQAYELTGIFQFVSVLTNIKIFPSFYECSMVLALIVRRWADERDGKIPPASPDDLEPVVKVWLADKGFKEPQSLLRLADAVGGSLRYGLLVLTLSLPKPKRENPCPRRIPRSKVEKRYVVPKELLENVRKIHNQVCPRQTSDKQESHPRESQTPVIHDEISLIQMIDDLELIEDEEHRHVFASGPDLDKMLSGTESPRKPLSFRSAIKLLVGNRYQLKGNTRRTRFFFWVRAELSPIGERNPHVWATAAQKEDPGARLAFLVYRQKNGFETWSTYATSDSWEARCQANSLMDRFEGSSLIELCNKPRRYVYIDDRYTKLKRENPELIPFVGGAYTDDEMNIIAGRSSRRGGKHTRPRKRKFEEPNSPNDSSTEGRKEGELVASLLP
ncbi:hypothetical protein BJY04DRAFT_204911 [Aspergillus karnatakaensis]|uniref:uncharacterized protein n=1 Tax=Aspergillus karnatakaensis TaxID=1810916 RepID=UPI003CCCAC20